MFSLAYTVLGNPRTVQGTKQYNWQRHKVYSLIPSIFRYGLTFRFSRLRVFFSRAPINNLTGSWTSGSRLCEVGFDEAAGIFCVTRSPCIDEMCNTHVVTFDQTYSLFKFLPDLHFSKADHFSRKTC